jgi:hypothetical protein
MKTTINPFTGEPIPTARSAAAQAREARKRELREPAQEVSEETKKFIRDRIGRISFVSTGATRK